MEYDPGFANIFYSLETAIYQTEFSEMVVRFLLVLTQFTVTCIMAIVLFFLRIQVSLLLQGEAVNPLASGYPVTW